MWLEIKCVTLPSQDHLALLSAPTVTISPARTLSIPSLPPLMPPGFSAHVLPASLCATYRRTHLKHARSLPSSSGSLFFPESAVTTVGEHRGHLQGLSAHTGFHPSCDCLRDRRAAVCTSPLSSQTRPVQLSRPGSGSSLPGGGLWKLQPILIPLCSSRSALTLRAIWKRRERTEWL